MRRPAPDDLGEAAAAAGFGITGGVVLGWSGFLTIAVGVGAALLRLARPRSERKVGGRPDLRRLAPGDVLTPLLIAACLTVVAISWASQTGGWVLVLLPVCSAALMVVAAANRNARTARAFLAERQSRRDADD